MRAFLVEAEASGSLCFRLVAAGEFLAAPVVDSARGAFSAQIPQMRIVLTLGLLGCRHTIAVK